MDNSKTGFEPSKVRTPHFITKLAKILLGYSVVALLVFSGAGIAGEKETQVVRLLRADFIENDSVGGSANIFVDKATDEIYIGHGNRVFILNSEGFLISKLYLEEDISAYRVAVDTSGTIFILDRRTWSISRFDQFGKKLDPFEIKDSGKEDGQRKMTIRSMAIDLNDNLYLLDKVSNSCFIVNVDGKVKGIIGEGELEFYTDVDVSLQGKSVVFLSYPKRKIKLYDTTGNLLAEFGRLGGGPGTFSQPVAIAVGPDGKVFTLDKNRQAILIFGRDGQFLSEFGGLGTGPGSFYYPNDIFLDQNYNIFIADTSNRRIQRLRIELLTAG